MGLLFAQYGALPWRSRRTLEVALISTRGRGVWMIPKGWPMRGLSSSETAAREAWEEAGVVGSIARETFGWFDHAKRTVKGERLCRVFVYPLEVTLQLHAWPERRERIVQWLRPAEAARMVENTELATLILEFDRRFPAAPGAFAAGAAEDSTSSLQTF